MKNAIREINRRRKIQKAYNTEHGITPQAISKEIRFWAFGSKEEIAATEFGPIQDIKLLEKEMKQAAQNLDFERASQIRDLLNSLKDGTVSPYANQEISRKGAQTKQQKKGKKPQKKK
jgi:excinuclease ABC subunit B